MCHMTTTPPGVAITMARAVLKKISEMTCHNAFKGGETYDAISPYESVEDWLYDLYPALPWDEEGSRFALNFLLNDPAALATYVLFENVHGFDFFEEFTKAYDAVEV